MANHVTPLSPKIPSWESKISEEEKKYLPFALDILKEMMQDPEKLCCPIGLSLFKDPVLDDQGYTYEKENLLNHFAYQKKIGVPLTSPLNNEAIEDERTRPNRDKKSEVEEYKIQRANQCFEYARQCISNRCGDAALLLIGRAQALNPRKEGLKEMEAQAQETFISIYRKKIAYIQRAKLLLQENHPEDALNLLKPLGEIPMYKFSLSSEEKPFVVNSTFLDISPDGKYLVTGLEKYPYNGGYYDAIEIWDTQKRNCDATLSGTEFKHIVFQWGGYLSQVWFTGHTLLILGSRTNFPVGPLIMYNISTRKAQDLSLDSSLGIYAPDTSQPKPSYNSFYSTFYRQLKMSLRVLDESQNTMVGIMLMVSISEYKVSSYETEYEKRENVTHMPKGYLIFSNGTVKSIQYPDPECYDSNLFHAYLTGSSYSYPPPQNVNLKSYAAFVKKYFDQMPVSPYPTIWNARWQTSGNLHPAAHSFSTPYLCIRNCSIIMKDPSSVENPPQRPKTKIYNIQYTYIPPTHAEEIELYRVLFQAALPRKELDSLANAAEHLTEYHSQTHTWQALEEFTSSCVENTTSLHEKITETLQKASKLNDPWWGARLRLLEGLLQKNLLLKHQSYKEACRLDPSHRVFQSAREFTRKSRLAPLQNLNPDAVHYLLKMKDKARKQKKEIEELRELVNKLLLQQERK